MEVQNTKAEQAVLGSILKNGDLIKETTLTVESFQDYKHQSIFTAMKGLENKNEPIDIISLNMELGQDVMLIGGSSYLTTIEDSITNTDDFKRYESYVVKAERFKKAKQALQIVNEEVISPKDLERFRSELEAIQNVLAIEQKKRFDLMENLMELHEEAETLKEGLSGIDTGFAELNALLDGLNTQDLIIVGARPSVGKTAFALNVGEHVAKSGEFVDIFSLEMPDKQLLKRMLCSLGNIDSLKMKNPMARFSESDWNKHSKALGELGDLKNNLNIVDTPGVTLQDIRSEVARSVKEYPDQKHVVIIDYITLIRTPGKQPRTQEVGEISRGLKRMARELDVCVICLAQLSRAVEQRQDKRPILSDLRDSGEIEQDADIIAFLYRDEYYDKESDNKNIIEIIIAKHRNGPLGTVELAFIKEYNKFINLDRRYEG